MLTILSPDRAPAALTFAGNDAVAVAQADGHVLRWSWATATKPAQLGRPGRPRQGLLAAAFSEEGRDIALSEPAGITMLTSRGRRPRQLRGRDVYALAVSADASTVVGANGRRVVVWKPHLEAPPVVLRTSATVRAVATNRDGSLVAIGDNGHAVRVWDLSGGGRRHVVLAGSQGPVTAVAFSPDGRRIVSGGDAGVLRVWDWDVSRPRSVSGAARHATRLHLTRDERLLVLDRDTPAAASVEATGRPRRLEGVLQPDSVSLSRDGRRAVAPVVPTLSRSLQLWNVDSSPHPRTIAASEPFNDVALSPDGRWIAFAGSTLLVSAWPGHKARSLAPARPAQFYTAVAFAPDGRRFAAARFDAKNTTISMWTVPTAGFSSLVASPPPDRIFTALGNTSTIAFSRDGERLVSAQSDGSVRIWDLDQDSAPVVLRGHGDAANSAAFSPDGTELVSGGSDGTVRVWRLGESPRSTVIAAAVGHIVAVAFTPDGKVVISVGTRGARSWACDFCGSTTEVVAVADRITTRSLTSDERAFFLHHP